MTTPNDDALREKVGAMLREYLDDSLSLDAPADEEKAADAIIAAVREHDLHDYDEPTPTATTLRERVVARLFEMYAAGQDSARPDAGERADAIIREVAGECAKMVREQPVHSDFALSHEDGAELMAQKIERRFGGGV